MVFFNFKRKIIKSGILLSSVFIFLLSFVKIRKQDQRTKSIYISISRPELYHRYFYILCKYFLIENYFVYIKRSLRDIYYLKSNLDSSLLFKEVNLFIGKDKNLNPVWQIDDSKVNPNYFDFLVDSKFSSDSYFIPIGFSPLVYYYNFWNLEKFKGKRFNSLFLAGNFGKEYLNDCNDIVFNTINRYDIKIMLERCVNYINIELKTLDGPLENLLDSKVYLFEKNRLYKIPPSYFFYSLSRFDFFFAVPGLYMPYCHNIIEAMSVGTIPFLQESYADIFHPKLRNGINCITFKDKDDLMERIEFLLSLDQSIVLKIREGVLNYYSMNLTSKAIVSMLVNNQFSSIYLMAEQYSVCDLSHKIYNKPISFKCH